MKKLVYLFLFSAAALSAQTAVWPGAVATDSQLLVAANFCGSRLSGSIQDTTSTTIFVTNATLTPTCFLANEEVQVDNEMMQITSVGFGQLTVIRGFDNSTASTHNNNAPINNVPAAWYHNALRVEVESIENWLLTHGGGGGGGSPGGVNGSIQYNNSGSFGGYATLPAAVTVYNQGSTNAVTQTHVAKFQQTIALDDFGCTPYNSASVNTPNCQNAIAYAQANSMILHCAGTYPINAALTLAAIGELQITGEGYSQTQNLPTAAETGCVISQTNAAVAVFSVNTNTNISPVTFQSLELTGGTNSIEIVRNGGSGHGSGIGPLTLKNVYLHYYTHAGIYLDAYSLLQGLYTTNDTWSAGSTTANGVMEDSASDGVGFITGWIGTGDLFGGGTNGIRVDSPTNSGGWTLTNENFHEMLGTPIVLLGTNSAVSFNNIGIEATGNGDNGGSVSNPLWNTTTGTTTGTNSTTITVASGTRLGAGSTLHVTQAASGFPTGHDFDTVIQSCSPSCGNSGSTVLTVSPAIPLIVTGVVVTNSQSNGIELNAGVTGSSPTRIYFYNSSGCANDYSIGDASSCRYGIYNPNGARIAAHSFFGTVYDPRWQGSPMFVDSGFQQIGDRQAPFFLNFGPTHGASGLPPYFRPWDGSPIFPTVTGGNPGAGGGEVHVGCGDGGTTPSTPGCSTTGVYGDVVFIASASNYRPVFQLSYNTGTIAIGPNGNNGGVLANLAIGNVNLNLQGLSAGIAMYTGGACPSSPISGAGALCISSNELQYYNPSGVLEPLSQPAKATSSTFGIVKPDNSTITVSGGVISAVGTSAGQINTGAGAPSSTPGAIQLNTTQGAVQITANGTTGQSVPLVPSVSVPLGDMVCASGNDPTISKVAISAAATSGSNTSFTTASLGGWALTPGTPVTISGSGDTGYNGNYTVVAGSGSTTLIVTLNSGSLTFTGAGTPIASMQCANSSDAVSSLTSFATNYAAPANSFAALGKQLELKSQFQIWTSTTQTNNLFQMYWSDGTGAIWTNNGSTATGGLTNAFSLNFPASLEVTATDVPGSTVRLIAGGIGFSIPGFASAGLYNTISPLTRNTTGIITYTPRIRWTASGSGGSITVAGSPTVTGSSGQYCLATATGTQNGGTGAVWYFILTGTNTVAGAQSFSAGLPGANTGSSYTAVPTATWTLTIPTANSVSGVVPAAACSGTATASGGTLVGAMGNAVMQLTQRRIWYY